VSDKRNIKRSSVRVQRHGGELKITEDQQRLSTTSRRRAVGRALQEQKLKMIAWERSGSPRQTQHASVILMTPSYTTTCTTTWRSLCPPKKVAVSRVNNNP
jgi:hypothetical protein